MGRNPYYTPGMASLDARLMKTFPVHDNRAVLQMGVESFNILNHTNFANPAATLGNALGTGTNQLQPGQAYTSAAAGGVFGQATSTVTKDVGLGAQRQIQFSLRLNF